MKIFKYPLQITDEQTILIPQSAKILTVIEQQNVPVVYALVNENEFVKPVKFYVVGTGNPAEHICNDKTVLVGTAKTHGIFVWHVFYESTVR